jgi:hypothetical protein
VTDEPPNTADHEERIAELERAVLALKIIVVGLFIGQAGGPREAHRREAL